MNLESKNEIKEGWQWSCDLHDTSVFSSDAREIALIVASHEDYFKSLGNPCDLNSDIVISNSDSISESRNLLNSDKSLESNMSRVKKIYPRAWMKWDTSEDSQLRTLFAERVVIEEIAILHSRTVQAIFRRLKKLGVVDEEFTIDQVKAILNQPNLKKSNTILSQKNPFDGLKEVGSLFQNLVQ